MIVDRIRLCDAPNAHRIALPVVHIVVHHTSLSEREPHNPDPVSDDNLCAVDLARAFCRGPMSSYTAGRYPYHLLIGRSGVVEQALPLTLAAAHARDWNRATWAVAYAGEHGPTPAQQAALVRVCRLLVVLSGGASIKRHDELPGSSADARKVCPAPLVSSKALTDNVCAQLPQGWRTWDAHAKRTHAIAAGLIIDAAEAA